jgi:PAS domain S-box-containing protein
MNTKGTILVVDDAPVNLKLLVGVLTADGYDVLSAEDGETALASMAAHVPELVLLDICMPGLDGFEVCRRLRARVESRDIPVMFISATGESAERVEGLRLGAVDFITKPFQREELLARVQTHLELRRLRVRLEQQADGLRKVNEQLQSELAERKRAEEALRDSELRFRSLIENMLEGVAFCEMVYGGQGRPVDFVYLEVNRAFERLTGLKDVVGRRVSAIIPGLRETSPELFESYGRVAATGIPEKFEFDLKELGQRLSISVYSSRKGHFVAVFDNITERKRIEDKLRQLSQAVEQSPASIVITNPAGDIEYANPKFIELTGYALEEVLGKNSRILKSGDKPQETYRELWQAITSGKEWHGEFHNRKKDGELYWESASISPIRDPAGRVTHYLAVKEDITARKQTEAERDRLIRDLQSALANVKSLSGLLPICAGCKKIRDDKGYWSQVESYVQKHSEARFSHGMCPDCIKKWYPEIEQPGFTDPTEGT